MTRQKFRYGQHETFAVRHGWLTKGVKAIAQAPDGLRADLEVADTLGLGSKMVPSLAFWMEAAGLARRRAAGEGAGLELTALGRAAAKHDPFFEYPVTWWMVHLNLARRENTVWGWFFQNYDPRLFDRNACTDAFERHARERAQNPPSAATAQKDVACLIAAYAASPSGEREDYEDVTGSPLRELGLIWRHEANHRFERVLGCRPPCEAFVAAACLLAADGAGQSATLAELAHGRKGPGRLFGMTPEAVAEAARDAERRYQLDAVSVQTLGADRLLVVPKYEPADWLERHFDRLRAAA